MYPVDTIDNRGSKRVVVIGQGTGSTAMVTDNGGWDPRQREPNHTLPVYSGVLPQRSHLIQNSAAEGMFIIGQGAGTHSYVGEDVAIALSRQVLQPEPIPNNQAWLGWESYQQQAWQELYQVRQAWQELYQAQQAWISKRDEQKWQSEMELKQRETRIQQAERELQQRETRIQQTETELQQRETRIEQAEKKLEQRESDFQLQLQQCAKVVKQREMELTQRETKLKQQEMVPTHQEMERKIEEWQGDISHYWDSMEQACNNGQVNNSQCQVTVDRTNRITSVSGRMLPEADSSASSEPDVPVTASSETPTALAPEPDKAVQPTSGTPKTIKTRIISLFSRKDMVSRKAKVA